MIPNRLLNCYADTKRVIRRFRERRGFMAKQIWVRKGQDVRGPFPVAEIRRLATAGKLTAQHEISSDQKRWKVAGDVPGLGFTNRSAERTSDGQPTDVESMGGGAGLQVAVGVLLLVVLTLFVVGYSLLNLGLVAGLVFTGWFLMTVCLGYPAASLGRDVSAIYILVMAVIWVLLLGDSPIRFGTTVSSWLGFMAGLVPGVLIVAGWALVTRGLGHDNEIADMARLNPSRFSSTPLSEKDRKRAVAATGANQAFDSPRRVRLRLDPDDLDRAEETLGETSEHEARRSVPGLAVSFVLHAVLLLVFAFWQLRIFTQEDLQLEGGWKTISAKEQTLLPPENRNLNLEAVKINQQKPPEVEEKPLQPLNPGPQNAVPVKPVEVGGLFDGRSEENRKKILNREAENTKSLEGAITMGLGWMLRQQESDGRWKWDGDYPDACDWPNLHTDTGATAMALLAFLGDGQTHQSAKNDGMQEAIGKGLNWLISQQKKNGNGDFHDRSQEFGRQPAFYAHSQATMVMCEAYALTQDRKLFEAAQKGVQHLLDSQQPDQGGWRYQTQDSRTEGDLSVTGWALMALHSARAVGISVPDEAFHRASKFLNSVQEQNGAHYRYQPSKDWPVTRAMTAEGLLCRQYFGWPRSQLQLEEGIQLLWDEDSPPRWNDSRRNVYEWYFTGQVLHNLNSESWKAWYAAVQKEIIKSQLSAGRGYRGSWHPTAPPAAPDGASAAERGTRYDRADNVGRLYMTAMCLLILETPIRHQPIYRN